MTSSDTVYCTSCGAANRIQATYCFSCGQLIQRGTSAPSSFPPAPPASETGRLRIGHTLKQRYKIISLLGQGGMGAVYKAEDIQFGNRLIAAKEMSLSRLNPLEMDHAVKQFKQEAYLLAGLKHPNLPSIYDYFEEDKRWYLIMDFIDGQTLEEYIQTKPNQILPVKEALDLAIQLSKVLNYLHTRSPQIIFRDLKPLNIMITPEKHLYLIDFGIARLFKPGQEKDTVAYFSAGYTAPEQFGTAQTAPQSDVYSLGATLHRILSGKEPRLNQPPFNFKPLDIYHSSLPPSLVALVAQMVKADMKQRPESMVVVKQELENIQQQVLYNKPLQTSHTPQQPFSPPQSFLAPPPPPQSPSLPQSQYNFNANVPPALAQKQPLMPPAQPYQDKSTLDNSLSPASPQQQPSPSPIQPSQIQIQNLVPPVQQKPSNDRPALPKGGLFFALFMGILWGLLSTGSLYLLRGGLIIVMILTVLGGFLSGFTTALRVVDRSKGLLAGGITGLTVCFTIMLILLNSTSNSSIPTTILIVLLICIVIGGILGLFGAWVATRKHPYYQRNKNAIK